MNPYIIVHSGVSLVLFCFNLIRTITPFPFSSFTVNTMPSHRTKSVYFRGQLKSRNEFSLVRFVLWATTKHCDGVERNGSLFLQSGCLSAKRLNSVVRERDSTLRVRKKKEDRWIEWENHGYVQIEKEFINTLTTHKHERAEWLRRIRNSKTRYFEKLMMTEMELTIPFTFLTTVITITFPTIPTIVRKEKINVMKILNSIVS